MTAKRTRTFIALLAAALLLPAGAAHAAANPGGYVALGDSYSAAPLVPNQVGKPADCLRSDHNYPSLVAGSLGAAPFTDVSCSSAETKDMTSSQKLTIGRNAPQFDALRSDTKIVTLGIGGNDVGLVGAAVTCATLGLLAPTGTACRSHFNAGGTDAVVAKIAATAPKIAAVLQGIRERSPAARIVLVGYPDVLPRTGNGCYPIVPLSPDDVRYFDGLIVKINAMLSEQAAANGAEFADTYDDSVGHDVCTLPGTKWFEGLVPTSVAFPLHPNALGEQSMARSVLRVLDAPRPGPVITAFARAKRSIARGRAERFTYRLNRPATVMLALARATSGRRRGASCRRPTRANRDARHCRRYVTTIHTAALGQGGDNTFTISASDYRRRAGLYRLVATPSTDDGDGAAQVALFRVKR